MLLFFIWTVGGAAFYITEIDEIEDTIPNPGKRALVCLMAGPIAWFFHIIVFWFIPAGEIFYETFIDPFIEWLKKD